MDNDLSPLADTEVHYLTSSCVRDEFKLFVGHCGTAGRQAVPVLYLTDANGFFGGTVDLVRSMQLARHLPPLLVVGIGYRAGGLADTIALRTRDLTPWPDPGFAGLHPDQSVMGGSGALLDFIETELKPWVSARYDVDPGDASYFGHSLGGLFGTYVLLTFPGAFRRYVIGSPSLWWDHGSIFDDQARQTRTGDGDPDVAYFGVGAHETNEGRRRQDARMPATERAKGAVRYVDMVADTIRMTDRLRQRNWSTRIDVEVFPGEYHITVPFLTLSRGLRRIFGAPA